MFTGAFRRRW